MNFKCSASTVIRRAEAADLRDVEGLLRECDLPTGGVDAMIGHCFIATDAHGGLVGVAGVDPLDDGLGLLRSVAVAPRARGEGLAGRLYEHVLDEARDLGLNTLYLLTTTAETYFAARGFVTIDRERVPGAVSACDEFTTLCPDSATIMRRRLGQGAA